MSVAAAPGPRPARRRIRIIAVLVAILLPLAGLAFAQTTTRGPARAEPPVKVEIRATPIEAFSPRDPSLRRFGALEFRGGLTLTSTYKDFGGLSAIRVQPDGSRFIAVSDRGRWLTGRIVYDGVKPVGIVDAEMAPVLGPDGKPLAARGWYDTEALAEDGGTVWLGIERVHRIVRFDFGRQGVAARGQPVTVPPELAKLPSNKGVECLVPVRKGLPLAGALIAISERGVDDAGNILGFLIGGPSPGGFTLKRSDDFDVSDCALLPAGDLLVLERKFSWSTGIQNRIRRIALASVAPGAVLDGPTLLTADMGYDIDNLEGLSVHKAPSGETVLTLVSDDNFSILQRTILLQFTLMTE